MDTFFRVLFWIFAAVYGLALCVWGVSVFGLFGQKPDPMSGVFLVVLGQPWVKFVDGLPEQLWPEATALTPTITLAVLAWLKRTGNR